MQNRTKIVATLGPASANEGMLRKLLEAGVCICRLNFSHGSLDQHADALALVRSVAAQLDRHVAVLGDLSGPKIRLGEVTSDHDGSLWSENPSGRGDLRSRRRRDEDPTWREADYSA